jgi:hypothetical protein
MNREFLKGATFAIVCFVVLSAVWVWVGTETPSRDPMLITHLK